MDVDGTGEWIGDGNLNGNMRFDSFQMSFTEGQSQFGSIYIDDLSIINNIDNLNWAGGFYRKDIGYKVIK